MKKFILPITLLLLAGSACKGRHADATPTGETVEVILPAPADTVKKASAPAEKPEAYSGATAAADSTPAQTNIPS